MQAPPLVGSAVAQLYRETLKRCRHLGGERGRGARLDAQHFYAKLRAAADGAAARAALEEAESRLAYLRMVTPRFRGARRVGGEDASDGGGSTKGSFVMRDGVLQATERRSGKRLEAHLKLGRQQSGPRFCGEAQPPDGAAALWRGLLALAWRKQRSAALLLQALRGSGVDGPRVRQSVERHFPGFYL